MTGRAGALQSVEATIVELGSMFTQLADLVGLVSYWLTGNGMSNLSYGMSNLSIYLLATVHGCRVCLLVVGALPTALPVERAGLLGAWGGEGVEAWGARRRAVCEASRPGATCVHPRRVQPPSHPLCGCASARPAPQVHSQGEAVARIDDNVDEMLGEPWACRRAAAQVPCLRAHTKPGVKSPHKLLPDVNHLASRCFDLLRQAAGPEVAGRGRQPLPEPCAPAPSRPAKRRPNSGQTPVKPARRQRRLGEGAAHEVSKRDIFESRAHDQDIPGHHAVPGGLHLFRRLGGSAEPRRAGQRSLAARGRVSLHTLRPRRLGA